jgi:hypothetical protein
MKKTSKTNPKRVVERDLFNELAEGMAALTEARHGKRTLRTHAVVHKDDTNDCPEGVPTLARTPDRPPSD